MPVTFTNRSLSGPVIVPLASGASLRLSPGETSPELPDVEAEANPALEKFVARGLVEVGQVDAGRSDAEGAAGPSRSKGGRGRARTDAGGQDEGADASGDATTSDDT